MAIDVPLDVQILIIEWVFRSSQPASIDYTTLHACALVCRAWTPTAQRLLFRRISCIFSDDIHFFRLLVSTLSIRPHLATHVRYIRVAWPSYPPDYGDVCLRLLELCRHVEGISFFHRGHNNKPLSAESSARLRAIQLRPVFLEVLGLPIGKAVVNMFPGVRFLSFVHGDEHPLPSTLETLKTRMSARQCLSLSESLPVLRNLCLIIPRWSDKLLCQHFNAAGILPRLRSLEIKGEIPPQGILEQLTQLETLVVAVLAGQHASLPASLRHFGYHPWRDVTPGAHVELALDPLRVLPQLQLVTVTRGVDQHVRTALEGMCHNKGVEFARYETPLHFQQPQYIDWI
ncbi:hypothetical protein FA95DRAFT_1559784 [Auriscalpium vulgare]|uniref:Uncharacterized protein n=1 Tax=Auriscalpium vulgare TaxID=40419 RepID=A0ACB8RTC8_9AGAM|nr:hypothetical protein FA95DRAFT_1559784 [Auriscalpium vulgare]